MDRTTRVAVGLWLFSVVVSALVVDLHRSSPGAAPDLRSVAATQDRPNVVLIMLDDMRADDLRFMPNAHRLLARNGTTYTRAIAPHPLCCPTRAELLTGQYGHNNGVVHNTGPRGGFQALRRPDDNIGAWLQDAGYFTTFHGKFLNGWSAADGRVAGWDRFEALVGGVYDYWNPRLLGRRGTRGRYVTSVLASRVRAAISVAAERNRPFFTVVNHLAPHVHRGPDSDYRFTAPPAPARYGDLYPAAMPPSWGQAAFNEADSSDKPADMRDPAGVAPAWMISQHRKRARAIRAVDDTIPRMVRDLRSAGELDDTYIVLTSDNGIQIGEHGLFAKNFLYDESLDVPLVVRGPGVAARERVGRPVSLIDLVPTILDWTGVPAGRPQDGLPLGDVVASRRDTILVQTGFEYGWLYRGVTTRRYLFAYRVGQPSVGILFDRKRDPQSLDNKYGDPAYATIRRELARRTHALEACGGPEECNRSFGTP